MFKINKCINKLFYSGICMAVFSLFCSCVNHGDEPKPKEPSSSTILVYAVATNSLTGNLVSDKNEMIQAAQNIDLNKNNILVFETQYKYQEDNTRVGNVNLLKLVKNKATNGYSWEIVKDYNDGIASLNPSRISEIINYVTENYTAENYGLVFWSHSTASQPYSPNNYSLASYAGNENSNLVSLPGFYSFGQDVPVGSGSPDYQINVDDLAAAIPDNIFNFIWFDSCYMSNIETIYQFRNKCNTFVGYPTEVLDNGLPYQNVLPYMTGKNPDLIKAAELFYQYYSNSFGTIAVVDTKKLDKLVDFCRGFYNFSNVPSYSLMKYSRYFTGPFYDFGDYSKALAAKNDMEISEELNKALDECILYKAITKGSLPDLTLYEQRFSGISTHLYAFPEEGNETDESSVEKYYKSLDWYKAVFQ